MLNEFARAALAATLAASLGSAALAQSHAGHGSHAAGPMDMKAMMKKNDEAMAKMPSTGDVDVDFAMMMRIHHQGALDMAEHQLLHGKDSQMKRMAKEIVAAQKKEIAVFDKFLASKGHAPKAR